VISVVLKTTPIVPVGASVATPAALLSNEGALTKGGTGSSDIVVLGLVATGEAILSFLLDLRFLGFGVGEGVGEGVGDAPSFFSFFFLSSS